MRKISANHILPVSSPPLQNGIITLSDQGNILKITDTGGKLQEESGLEFYPGCIIPGLVLPWLTLPQAFQNNTSPESFKSPETFESEFVKLDRELQRNGIFGVGLVLKQSMAFDSGFKLMQESRIIYHPVIELCPGAGADDFETLNRGIELVSHAWNQFKLHCSLTTCSGNTESRASESSDMDRYLREYASSHQNVSPPAESETQDPSSIQFSGDPLNILQKLRTFPLNKSFPELLSQYTLKAAEKIFEEDGLGSLEPGKNPGLILLNGLDPQTFRPGPQTSMKILG